MHPGGSISAGGDDVRSGEPNAGQPGRGNVFSGKDDEDDKSGKIKNISNLIQLILKCLTQENKYVNIHFS